MTTQYAKSILAATHALLHGTTAMEREWIIGHLSVRSKTKTLQSPLGNIILEVLKDNPGVKARWIMVALSKRNCNPSKTELHNCLGHLKRIQMIMSPRRGLYAEIVLKDE
jgi:hypothetical protein